MTKRIGLMAATLVAALAWALPAKASTINFAFDGAVFDVSGTVVTDGANNVLSIVGNVFGPNGAPISGLEALGNPNWIYDNLFFSTIPYVTNGGILFIAGAFEYNLYSAGPDYYVSTFNPNGSLYNPGDVGTLSASPVPGPLAGAGIPGLVMAIGGLLALARRRRQRANNVTS